MKNGLSKCCILCLEKKKSKKWLFKSYLLWSHFFYKKLKMTP
jgi:hypothetical protein